MTRLYASNLKRAVRTAQEIAEAQSSVDGGDKSLGVVQVPELREKDFGSDEGKRFGKATGDKAAASSASDYVPHESKDAMKIRCTRFINTVLVPAVAQVDSGAIVIVAHGIILNTLLGCLLSRFGPNEVAKLARPANDALWRSEWLATWSNTGYLEAVLRVANPVAEPAPDAPEPLSTEATATSPTPSRSLEPIIQLSVKAVNCIQHLQGLNKTRGGIGSAASDSKQRTMDSFFSRAAKKPKTGNEDS